MQVNDPAAIAEALLLSSEKTGDESFRKAADKPYFYLKYRTPRSNDGIIYHFNIQNEVWIDAYYMAPAFICRYWDVDEAMKQIKGFRKYLFDTNKKLRSHIWDDDIGDFRRKDFWSVGNGWAVAGITRVINMLPQERKENREYLISYVRDIIDGCIA